MRRPQAGSARSASCRPARRSGRRDTMPTIAAAIATVAAPGTPACSNAGANARPVAGPPVSVTEPFSTPNSGCMPERHRDQRRRRRSAARRAPWPAAGRSRTCGPPTLQQRQARAEADGREERDHQRRLQPRVERRRARRRATARRQHRRGDQQPADDRRRHVVARQPAAADRRTPWPRNSTTPPNATVLMKSRLNMR